MAEREAQDKRPFAPKVNVAPRGRLNTLIISGNMYGPALIIFGGYAACLGCELASCRAQESVVSRGVTCCAAALAPNLALAVRTQNALDWREWRRAALNNNRRYDRGEVGRTVIVRSMPRPPSDPRVGGQPRERDRRGRSLRSQSGPALADRRNARSA